MNPFQHRDTAPHKRIDPVYDEFLYTQLGEEANGMQLSVLSALARQNVDPWEIAQKLSSLPREPAIRFLTPLLAGVPDGAPDREAPEVLAKRLVAMLPSLHTSAGNPGPAYTAPKNAWPNLTIDRFQLIVAFALLMLFVQLLFSGPSQRATAEKPMSPTASVPAGAGAAPSR